MGRLLDYIVYWGEALPHRQMFGLRCLRTGLNVAAPSH
jgi:hypothetical protein